MVRGTTLANVMANDFEGFAMSHQTHRSRSRLWILLAAVSTACWSLSGVASPVLPGIQAEALSNQHLAQVNGKGIPVNLPKLVHQNGNGVVLWDELQGKGGNSISMQSGGSNLQSASMQVGR